MKIPVDLSLVLACYNEAPIFRESVKDIACVLKRSNLSYEIIFVDDKSSDRTGELIDSYCKTNNHCRALYHTTNIGRGKTVSDGIKAANGKVVGFIDIDCEISPIYIPDMVDRILRNEADVVIGKRIYRSSFSSLLRELLSVGYRRLANILVDTGNLDTETGYKFFRRKKILPVIALCRHAHWFWDTEIMVYSRRAGLKIKEIPVLFMRRTDKISSVRVFRDVIDYCINLWRLRRRLNRVSKPYSYPQECG